MFCSICGQEIDSGERFCSKCGAPAKRSANTKKSISPLANILIILAVVFLIAGVILAVVFLSKSNQKINEINSSETTADDISTNETSAGAGKAKSAETTAAVENTAATATAAATTVTPSGYNIGDTGPAGGLIFYINPNYTTDGWRYLEAASSDFPIDNNDYRIPWYNGNYVETGATGTAIGTGMPNTQKIVNIQGEGSYAAKLCYDLTQGSFSDWFLPSRDELNLMYENLHLKGLGSFEPGDYWSSSEGVADGAWVQGFGGGQIIGDKYYGGRVRAVRAF
jgi:predicted nucleic acid-binding Zn ribbon protein